MPVSVKFHAITLQHGCPTVTVLHIFRIPIYDIFGGLLLNSKRFEKNFISLYSIKQVEIVTRSIYL